MSEAGLSILDNPTQTAGFQSIPTPDWLGRLDSNARSSSTLLLGLGNDILCDDAIGLLVAREILRRMGKKEGIDVHETCEMGLALLDYIIGYKDLVLVDAIQTRKAPPGHIHEFDGADLKILPVTSPHFLGVGEMIALGRQLGFPVPERVKIFAIEVQDAFTITTHLTSALQKALPEIVDRVWAALVERGQLVPEMP